MLQHDDAQTHLDDLVEAVQHSRHRDKGLEQRETSQHQRTVRAAGFGSKN